MDLAGQARNARGYAMAALLVAMSVAAVLMTAAMPVWKQMVQREKEEELIFRGKQYVHAITLYGRKFANTQPPSIDVLVNQKFLRKKYKDPITNDDFQLVMATVQAPGRGGGPGSTTPGGPTGSAAGAASPAPRAATAPSTPAPSTPGGTIGAGATGGILGVTSKSKDKSIRLYNGRSHYNEWVFTYQPAQVPGTGGGGAGVPGGRTGGPNPPGGTGGTGPFGGSGGTGPRGGDGRGNRGGDGRSNGPGGRGPGTPPGGFGTTPFGPRGRI